MSRLLRFIGVAVIGLGLAALVMGIVFVVEGQSKANYIKQSMREEQVSMASLGIEGAPARYCCDLLRPDGDVAHWEIRSFH
jgi:hypothetical protein